MLEIASLTFITLLGAMSPGPDFALVTRHALTGSRKAALLASLGISAALLIHVTYCSLGIALLLKESPILFRIIQISGSCYLAYLGIRLLLSSKGSQSIVEPPAAQAFTSGFLTNLLNPKATLFIMSIFTQFVKPGTLPLLQAVYGLVIAATSFAWFCSLSFLITHSAFQPYFARFQTVLIKGMGVVLIVLALYVVVSTFL